MSRTGRTLFAASLRSNLPWAAGGKRRPEALPSGDAHVRRRLLKEPHGLPGPSWATTQQVSSAAGVAPPRPPPADRLARQLPSRCSATGTSWQQGAGVRQ